MATPRLVLLPLVAFVRQAWRDGVRLPCFAYRLPGVITCYQRAATPSRLAHEWMHEQEPDRTHLPFLAFDVFSYNPLRVHDSLDLLPRSAAWRAQALAEART